MVAILLLEYPGLAALVLPLWFCCVSGFDEAAVCILGVLNFESLRFVSLCKASCG